MRILIVTLEPMISPVFVSGLVIFGGMVITLQPFQNATEKPYGSSSRT